MSLDTETFQITHDPLDGMPIDLPPAMKARKTAQLIIAEVAAEYRMRASEITGPGRHAYMIEPRWVAMRRIRSELGYSLNQIGRIFDRHHTSVLWALRGGRPNQPPRSKQSQERAA